VESLSDEDPRLLELQRLQEPYGLDVFAPGETAQQLVSRHGFRRHPGSVGDLLEAIIESELEDSTENIDDEMRRHRLTDEAE
jgi:hypothetical protein